MVIWQRKHETIKAIRNYRQNRIFSRKLWSTYAATKNTWQDFEQLIVEKDENVFDLMRNFLLQATLF